MYFKNCKVYWEHFKRRSNFWSNWSNERDTHVEQVEPPSPRCLCPALIQQKKTLLRNIPTQNNTWPRFQAQGIREIGSRL